MASRPVFSGVLMRTITFLLVAFIYAVAPHFPVRSASADGSCASVSVEASVLFQVSDCHKVPGASPVAQTAPTGPYVPPAKAEAAACLAMLLAQSGTVQAPGCFAPDPPGDAV